MQVKDLTTEELKSLIRETVLETLEAFLDNADSGREARPEEKQQLIDLMQRMQEISKKRSLSQTPRVPGQYAGTLTVPENFNDPLPDDILEGFLHPADPQ